MPPLTAARLARALNRNPALKVALALAAVSVLAFLLVKLSTKRRRENWEFKGAKGTAPPITEKHKAFIMGKCAAGYDLTSIKKNDDWKWMAKYDGGEVWNICKQGVDFNNSSAVKNTPNAPCKYKRGPCPVPEVARLRPCLNMNGDKCCFSSGKNCVPHGKTRANRVLDGYGRISTPKGVTISTKRSSNSSSTAAPTNWHCKGGLPCWLKEEDRGTRVKLYEKSDGSDPSGGWTVTTTPSPYDPPGTNGQWGYPNAMSTGNDRVSAVYVPKNITVTLYPDPNGGGKGVTLTKYGVHSLGGTEIDKKVSSLSMVKR